MNKKTAFRSLLNSLVILSVLVVTFLLPSSALAAPACSGNGCNYQDPYAMRCAGSGASYGVVATKNIYDAGTNRYLGYVQLWWSYTCKTNWSRTVATVSNSSIETYVISGNNSDWEHNWNGGNELHSMMFYAPTTKSQACGAISGDGYSSNDVCTVWK